MSMPEKRLRSPLSSTPSQSAAPVPKNRTNRSSFPASPVSDEYPAANSSAVVCPVFRSAALSTAVPLNAPTAAAAAPALMKSLLFISFDFQIFPDSPVFAKVRIVSEKKQKAPTDYVLKVVRPHPEPFPSEDYTSFARRAAQKPIPTDPNKHTGHNSVPDATGSLRERIRGLYQKELLGGSFYGRDYLRAPGFYPPPQEEPDLERGSWRLLKENERHCIRTRNHSIPSGRDRASAQQGLQP